MIFLCGGISMGSEQNKLISLIRALLAYTLVFAFIVQLAPHSLADIITTTIEPTCTEPGQVLTEDTEAHVIKAETIPATGHSFGDWLPIDSFYEERVCAVCGEKETRITLTAEERAIPWLMLYGSMDGINKKTRVTLKASFIRPGDGFECYSITSIQGHSTLGLDKPNYTVRFYDDADGGQKHKVSFGNWHKEHKYILKADYYDVTQCRNLVGAELWRELTKSRENVHPRIAALPTLGAVDGFPISLWLNDEFLGLYTFCLHKDDDLFDMEKGEQAAILICNDNSEEEAVFRAPAIMDTEGIHNWEMEFCGTEDWTWARNSFNSLVDFVMNSSDEEFRGHLVKYLDVNTAVDYLIFIYVLGLVNSGAKDLVLVSFGNEWIPSAYDMDEAFGLMPAGKGIYAPDYFLPHCEDGRWTSETSSLLWDRLLQNYEEEIRIRYRELRSGALSEEKILALVDSFTEAIPMSLYLRDAERYPGRPNAKKMIEQIHTYVTERLPMLDAVLGGK